MGDNSINWDLLKPRCPKCNSTRLTKTDIYKEEYIIGRKKRKELRKHVCEDCGEEIWK